MEVLPSTSPNFDDDKRNLEQLLEAFGSMVSIEDIASAYCQAGRDICVAAEILCKFNGNTSSTSTSAYKDELEGVSSSSEWSRDNFLRKSRAEKNPTAPKQRKCSALMGTVSGVIGREYARTKSSINEVHKVNRPLKLELSELPTTEIWDAKALPDGIATSETMHKDVEEFLFKMLGDGFRLDMNVIREVLGLCRYDARKSMEKLLDMSAFTLEKSEGNSCITTQKHMVKSLDLGAVTFDKKSEYGGTAGSSGADVLTRNGTGLTKRDKDRYALQKEVLEALFSVPERVEEAPKKTRPAIDARRRAFGSVVAEPLRDNFTVLRTAAKPEVTKDETDEEDGFDAFLKAEKEYWITMKEYYKSAVDAFAQGDCTRANKLMEEGHFFMNKAREANDKSAQKILETSDVEEDVSLDLHDHEPKEAVRSLKCHLTSLSGIPSIQNLKVLVGANDNDTKGVARKKLIVRLLERNSIKWTEEGNGQMIVIKVDEINPKRLSFAK